LNHTLKLCAYKEAANYPGKDQLKYTLDNVSCYFKTDIEDFLQSVIIRGRTEEVEFLLKGKIKNVFSVRNRISACAWVVRNNRTELCEEWLQEIDVKKFEYIPEKWYKQKYTELEKKKEKFKIIADIMYILTYVSKEGFDELRAMAIEKSEFKNDRNDNIVAGNLLVAVAQIAHMEKCIFHKRVENVKVEDFNTLLNIIMDDRYYSGCFHIDTMTFRKRILVSIILIIDNLPLICQESLENTLCIKAETQSGIALLETYWKFLYVKGKGDLVKAFFDTWMNHDGNIWKEELSERDYIAEVLLRIAKEMNWQERIQKAVELLNARSIGYVGRKDYSLFNPLQWFERIAEKEREIWKNLGSLLMNISEYASKIGDNRAYIQIGSAVSSVAAKMGIDSFFQFVKMVKKVKKDCMEVVFDGIIAALEKSDFTEDELIILWKKTINYFTIDEYAKQYDSQNTKNKIYCSDIHMAISLCSNRMGYKELENRMQNLAPCEYAQRRLEKSEHSWIISKRWYESEYYENINSFIEVTKKMNCNEMFEYIETQYGHNEFLWDYIKYFIQTAERMEPQSVIKYKPRIMRMLKDRELNSLDYDGVNRLYDVLFVYLTNDEVAEVLVGILTTFYHHRNEGWTSAEFGLMTDLENFIFALFSRFSVEDNKWALQEILKMHCTWLNGTESLEIKKIYHVDTEEHVEGWKDFWKRMEMDKN